MYNNTLYFPKNIKELNKGFENMNNKFKIKNYNYKLIYDTSRLL